MTKLSILIPCSDTTYLGPCINSIKYSNAEIIVGLNNTDAKFVEPRVKVIYFGKNNQCQVRNQLFNFSKGEYIKYLDADDLLAENINEIELIEKAKSDILLSRHQELGRTVFSLPRSFKNQIFPVHSNSMLFTRKILLKLRKQRGQIFTNVPLNHSILLLTLLNIGASLHITSEIVSFWRKDWSPNQASKQRVAERMDFGAMLLNIDINNFDNVTYQR